MKAFQKKSGSEKGFTLVEMLIAMFVFSLIVGAVSGLFISAIRGQRSTLASQRLLDQTSYSLEYMSRALRMAIKEGQQADPLVDCLSQDGLNYETNTDGTSLKFINHLENDDCQEFFLNSGSHQLEQRKNNLNDTFPLTSSKLQISSLKFFLYGEDQNDNGLQPRVAIAFEIRGIGQTIADQPAIIVQTMISQRNLDVKK